VRILVVVLALALAGSSAVAERLKGPDGQIREVPTASVDYAIRDGWRRLPQVMMRKPSGEVVSIDVDLAEAAERLGCWRMTPKEVADEVEIRKIMADAETERYKPGYFEEPIEAGSDHERSVTWETRRDRIDALLGSGYLRLSEEEYKHLRDYRRAAASEPQEPHRDTVNRDVVTAMAIAATIVMAFALLRRATVRR